MWLLHNNILLNYNYGTIDKMLLMQAGQLLPDLFPITISPFLQTTPKSVPISKFSISCARYCELIESWSVFSSGPTSFNDTVTIDLASPLRNRLIITGLGIKMGKTTFI